MSRRGRFITLEGGEGVGKSTNLSLVADYESGEFSSWSVGFRLDLDED